jgi:hypothetical protein
VAFFEGVVFCSEGEDVGAEVFYATNVSEEIRVRMSRVRTSRRRTRVEGNES